MRDGPDTSEEFHLKINDKTLTLDDIGIYRKKEGDTDFSEEDFIATDLREWQPIECKVNYGPFRGEIDYENRKNAGIIEYRKPQTGSESWLWTPQNFVGIYHLNLTLFKEPTKLTYKIPIKIKPSKILKKDFDFLVTDIRKRCLNIYDFQSPAKFTETREGYSADPVEQFKFLRDNFDKLEKYLIRITQNPNKKLVKKNHRDYLFNMRDCSADAIYDIATFRADLQKITENYNVNGFTIRDENNDRYIPERILNTKNITSFNLPENQLIKTFLRLIYTASGRFKKQLEILPVEGKNRFMEEIDRFQKKSLFFRDRTFLAEVDEIFKPSYHSLVFKYNHEYRRIYEMYKAFLMHPLFSDSEFLSWGIQATFLLYERWCLLLLADILQQFSNRGWTVNSNLFSKSYFKTLMEIIEGKEIITLTKNSKRISVYYQKRYRGYCKDESFCPDITIEKYENENLISVTVFDPKYRFYIEDKKVRTDPEAAINKMHVYKDAIVDDGGKRIVAGAFVLYPGEEEKAIFSPLKDALNLNDCIGAFRLHPNQESLEKTEESFEELLSQVID